MAKIGCYGCEFLESRKMRCRKLASLPHVGEWVDTENESNDRHPEFCPRAQTPLLEALLCGEKLWNSGAPALVQKNEMKKVLKALKKEHEYMCENEPQDQFHACVLLGAANLIEGLLDPKRKVLK